MTRVPAAKSEMDDLRLSIKTNFELQLRSHLLPFRQGLLDRLCGLYSIINGIRLVSAPTKPLTTAAANVLFDTGITYLSAGGVLHNALVDGIGARKWKHLASLLCNNASKQCNSICIQTPAAGGARLSAPAIESWIEQSIALGWPVLLHLGRRHQHYTVISGIDERQIWLFDSWGLKKLKRAEFVKRNDITASTMMRLTVHT